jgi:4-diphosphocytidyl-2-C-methyl-D-erythritol kinase
VPFSLLGGTALGTGRGELVEPIVDHGTWWWVVVPAAVGLSTPEVYRHFDGCSPTRRRSPPSRRRCSPRWRAASPTGWPRALHNDLQAPAIDLRPELGQLIEQGESAGALRGSSPAPARRACSCAGSADHARLPVRDLSGAGHAVVLAANGPVAGAHLVSYA